MTGPLLVVGDAKNDSDASVMEGIETSTVSLEEGPAFRPKEENRQYACLVDYPLGGKIQIFV